MLRHPWSTFADSSQRSLDSEDSDSSGVDEGARDDASGKVTKVATGKRRTSRLQGKTTCVCFWLETTLTGLPLPVKLCTIHMRIVNSVLRW